jgi:hypothetical protein
MSNKSFQNFGTASAPQTQVYPDGTVRIIQNNNPMAQDTKWITATAINQQQPQEQHPRPHPQIIQSNKVQSQAIYYSQGQNQGQGQPLIVKQSSIGGNVMTTPTMSYNSTIYTAQGQGQGQTQTIPLYSTSSMNIQVANTPASTLNSVSRKGNNNGASTVMMTQSNGTNVMNDISSSYNVAQPIQAQESKSYSNPIFVIPSPSTPTPQISYTTSSTTHSNPTIVQIQQTPPQTTLQQSTNTSQYIIAQKASGQIGMPSTQQVILQAPPTPYGTSPTSAQVQVLTQNGNNTIISPTQIQYQYSVTPPLNNEKEVPIKQENKVSPEMTIMNTTEVETSMANTQENSDTQAFSSSLISNPGRLFNKISISSPTSNSMYSVDSSSLSQNQNQNQNQNQEKNDTIMTKENLSPAGGDKVKLENKSIISQNDNSNTNTNMDISTGITVKEEQYNSMDISSVDPNSSKDSGNSMNIDTMNSKTNNNTNNNNNNNLNGIAVMTSTSTPLNPATMITQNISNSQSMIQTSSAAGTTQNINMIQGIQGVNTNIGNGVNKVNGINVINGMNGINNVSYINTVNGINANQQNVNLNGMNTIQSVQVATAIPQTINTMNNMNIMNNNNGNIINITPNQSTAVPINANNSINLYYNQGQNIMNVNPNTTTISYANPNIMKNNINKGSNVYNTRIKNSHIVDPDVPLEVLIKRRKNTEAARRSRLRKAERIQVLTEIVHNLEEKNKEYTLKIAELQGEQANWLKKEEEYTTTIKQLQERLNGNTSSSKTDENDINISTQTTTTATTTTTTTDVETTKAESTSNLSTKDSTLEN